MAIRRILTKEEAVLHVKCRPVEKFDEKLHQLLDDMIETLAKAAGVGLAAPQVGIRRRIAVIDLQEGDPAIELINPVILESRGAEVSAEGCLSVPGRRGTVERPTWVRVSALDKKGKPMEFEAEGLFARCICHELDHLDGVLYCDKMIEDVTDQTEKA